MCRTQLVKLRPHVKKLLDEGAVVFGMSMDTPEEASRLAMDLNLAFPILSDRNTVTVREYGMYGKEMGMPEMGYAVIDKEGRIRDQKIDHRLGENTNAILKALHKARSRA